jgi:protein transport protein SEC24
MPTTSSLLKKSKLPFALIIQPYATLHDAEDDVPVQYDQVIARCRRCRTYINPFASFLDHSHRWRCNMCNLTNDVPQSFDWDSAKQQSVDRWQRPELNYSVSEFVAPQEYMVRAPQPLIYLFLFDVSYAGVTSGLLATAARCILESLDRIPNTDRRTRLGFMAVDSSLHYFSIPRDGSENNDPKMLVVSDLEEPFLPTPEDLLVNLTECRANIENYLNKLQGMFSNTQDNGSAMGSALRAGHKLISHVGGKVVCLSASLPNIGHGKLEMREDKKLLGTSKENALLQTQNSFYKSFAVECSKTQVSIDMFLFSAQYQDVASLSNLPRYTGGQTYFYPAWNAARTEDAIKFATEFSDYLSSEIGLEAVLRVRTTTGLRPSAFYGNFFNRSSDLCAFPAMPRDQAYVVEIAIDESVTKAFACLQVGVLHTTCNGERRIRVLTLSIPTTQNLAEVYASADQQAITHYFAHKAVERALSSGLDAARDAVQAKIIELLQTYKKELGGGNMGGGGLQFPANLRGLPMLFLGLMKNVSTSTFTSKHQKLTSFPAWPPQIRTDPHGPPLRSALPPLYPPSSSTHAIHLPPPVLFARHARRRRSPQPRNWRHRHAASPQPHLPKPRPLRPLPPRRRPDTIHLARPRRRARSHRRRLRHRGQEPAQARQDFNSRH